MKVAVLIATYNGEKYLKDLLKSLEKQNYRDFKCYIHDDGSNDKTIEIIEKCRTECNLEMQLLEFPPTGSAKNNFMAMLQYIEEPYAMFCDQDDVWLENKIERSLNEIKKIEENGRPAMVFTDASVVDEDLCVISESFIKYSKIDPERVKMESLLISNVVQGATIIMNKKLYTIARRLSNTDNILMHDHWIALVASAMGSVSFIDEPLLLYRQHSDNEIGAVERRSAIKQLHMACTTDYRSNYRRWMTTLRAQAKELENIPVTDSKKRAIVSAFSESDKLSKIQRTIFYIKNGILKDRYKLWFLIWA